MGLQGVGHFGMVAMGASQWFRNDVIDNAEFEQVARRQFQGFGSQRLGLFGGGFPENARASFRADNGIIGVFEHADAVADADAQSAAGSPFPDDNANDGSGKLRHFQQIGRDQLGLAALLGADPRIGARSIDQAEDGQPVFGGE